MEILAPDMEPVIYGDVKSNVVHQIVDSHIINKKQVEHLVQTQRTSAV
ncbi:MAG: hypothetical protein Pg6C_14470 [Treponemataceae bacterium]|nr:MAG: hypothetical protein Pg6C_14470 [Treponemataceae bacterium]